MALSLEQKKAGSRGRCRSGENRAIGRCGRVSWSDGCGDDSDLREKAKQSGVYLRVVRNTLARRAVEGTQFECVQDRLKGPLVLAFSRDEPGAAARVMRDYAKSNKKLIVSFVAFDGRALDAPSIDQLASLPSRDEALSMLMSVLLAPATKLARTIAEPHAGVVRVVDAMRTVQADTA